jgi:hypothetical protein
MDVDLRRHSIPCIVYLREALDPKEHTILFVFLLFLKLFFILLHQVAFTSHHCSYRFTRAIRTLEYSLSYLFNFSWTLVQVFTIKLAPSLHFPKVERIQAESYRDYLFMRRCIQDANPRDLLVTRHFRMSRISLDLLHNESHFFLLSPSGSKSSPSPCCWLWI